MSTLKAINLSHPSYASANNLVLNSDGSSLFSVPLTTPSLPSGSWVLLNTLTASTSAAIQDTTSITSSYIHYMLVCDRLLPATNAVSLVMQLYSGGAYQTTGYGYSQMIPSNYNNSTAQAYIKLSWNNNQISNVAAGGGYSGAINIVNPAGTGSYKAVVSTGTNWDTNGGPGMLAVTATGCWAGGTGAITGFQLYMTSGNIVSGTVKVYGLKA